MQNQIHLQNLHVDLIYLQRFPSCRSQLCHHGLGIQCLPRGRSGLAMAVDSGHQSGPHDPDGHCGVSALDGASPGQSFRCGGLGDGDEHGKSSEFRRDALDFLVSPAFRSLVSSIVLWELPVSTPRNCSRDIDCRCMNSPSHRKSIWTGIAAATAPESRLVVV